MAWYADLISELYVKHYQDIAIDNYVTRVGQRLVRLAGIKEPVKFRIIDDPDPLAEAWAGGSIHVSRGALARLRSESELAALLGHEVGHLMAEHTDGQNRSQRDARDDEIQADEIAVRLTVRAGYDPTSVEVMLRAIHAGRPATCDATKQSHPCMTERLARIRVLVGGRKGGELGADRFRAAVAGLVTGPTNPLRVAVVGGTLVFGHARLAFGPPDAGDVTMVDGYGGIELDGIAVVVVPVSLTLAKSLAGKPPSGTAFYIGDRGALWIIVGDGEAASRRATELVRFVRAPRPDELATLHPTFYDERAPRPLWPN